MPADIEGSRFASLFERVARSVRARLAFRSMLGGAALGLAFALVPAVLGWRLHRPEIRALAPLGGVIGALVGGRGASKALVGHRRGALPDARLAPKRRSSRPSSPPRGGRRSGARGRDHDRDRRARARTPSAHDRGCGSRCTSSVRRRSSRSSPARALPSRPVRWSAHRAGRRRFSSPRPRASNASRSSRSSRRATTRSASASTPSRRTPNASSRISSRGWSSATRKTRSRASKRPSRRSGSRSVTANTAPVSRAPCRSSRRTTRRSAPARRWPITISRPRSRDGEARERTREARPSARKDEDRRGRRRGPQGRRRTGQALEEQSRLMDQRGQRPTPCAILADAMKQGGEGGDEVQTQSEALDREGPTRRHGSSPSPWARRSGS